MIIVAIGGAVVKTAYREIKQLARAKQFDVLIHNGGSLFHDFQLSTEKLKGHSYPLEELLKDYSYLEGTSELVWNWLRKGEAPRGSLTAICQKRGIKVLMFTGLGTDFWQLFCNWEKTWSSIGLQARYDFRELIGVMAEGPFHYVLMGSAVIHPEVFTKALAVVKPKEFRATVVDFKEMYRPLTRVGKYGRYHIMTHRQFLKWWISLGKLPEQETPQKILKKIYKRKVYPEFQESTGDG